MAKRADIAWLARPEPHNYPAAESYLSLLRQPSSAKTLVRKLRRSAVVRFKAKDIFRASGLSLVGVSNRHVERDRAKIRKGKALSPLLLVRDQPNGKVIIADGYHRLCAVYSFDEDALIPCQIAG